MKRTPLIVIAFAFAVACGAWHAHALAGGDSLAPSASAPTHASRFPPIPSPTRGIDEYGNISFEDEKARLDNLAIELQNDPTAKGYITCYGGRVGRAGAARRRCERAKRYLSGHRHIPPAQIVLVDGGYREDLTVTLWMVPPGASPPSPSPTVDPREVRFVKGKKKRTASRR
jgi:hypothetical protein